MLFKCVIQYELNDTIEIDTGILGASSWKAACERLIQFYGEKHIVEIKSLYELENPLLDGDLKDIFEKE